MGSASLSISGNTGFSSGPHLHFSIFKTKDGKERLSIPVRFRTADDDLAITLKEGHRYRSANFQSVIATASRPSERLTAQGSIGQ